MLRHRSGLRLPDGCFEVCGDQGRFFLQDRRGRHRLAIRLAFEGVFQHGGVRSVEVLRHRIFASGRHGLRRQSVAAFSPLSTFTPAATAAPAATSAFSVMLRPFSRCALLDGRLFGPRLTL